MIMNIITVASAKGGVGKSTFCCGVGNVLALNGKRVLLVDMDIGVRSLDILLGVSEKTVYNWGDIINGNCDYRRAVIETSKELYLLPAPMGFNDEYTPEAFGEMIESLKKDFDFIILDAPAGLESGFRLAVSTSKQCIIVSTPEATSIRAASYASQNVKGLGVDDVRLVVNRFNKKIHKNIDVDDIIDNVGARLVGIIPDSAEIYGGASYNKIPFDCKGNQAFVRIAKRLCGQNIPFKSKYL
jgi:septum site-determining protein MinD